MQRTDLLKERLNKINNQIGDATLLAVSKSTDLESIGFAFDHGQRDFGENRVDTLEKKALSLKDIRIRWHYIGNIQSNKITRLLKIPNLCAIHSIEGLKKVKSIYKKEEFFSGTSLGIYLQINTSGEDEKQGLSFEHYESIVEVIKFMLDQDSSKIFLKGLMTMGKVRSNDFEHDARICFKRLSTIKVKLSHDFNLPSLELSMGMSQDYQIALEEGSDLVRIGTDIFKEEV